MFKKWFNKKFFLRKNLLKEINLERAEERKQVEKEHKAVLKELHEETETRIEVLESSKNAEIKRLKNRIELLESERRNVNHLKQYSLQKIGEAVNISSEIRYHFEQSSQSMAKTFTLYDDLLDRAEKLKNEAKAKLERF